MSHRFGDVVLYQLGDTTVNALVVQSNPQPDGEHLVLLYLDPKLASNSMAGSLVDKAAAKAFATPLTQGKAYGWKELPEAEPQFIYADAEKVLLSMLDSHEDLFIAGGAEEFRKSVELLSSQDAQSTYTKGQIMFEGIPSEADLDADAAEKKAKKATALIDEAQGEVQPGAPESPHAIAPVRFDLEGRVGTYQPDGGVYPLPGTQKAAVAADPTSGPESSGQSKPISGTPKETSTEAPSPSDQPSPESLSSDSSKESATSDNAGEISTAS